MKKLLFIGVALLMAISSYAMTKSNSDEMHYVLNAKHPSCKVSLPSNPTTGYTWSAIYDKQMIVATHEYIAPKTKLVGAGGVDVWTFTATLKALNAVHPVKTVVRMIYSRSWEKNVAPAQTKLITIVVNNG